MRPRSIWPEEVNPSILDLNTIELPEDVNVPDEESLSPSSDE